MIGSCPVRAERPRGIVQVHPTTRCNLRCPHCYSESAPAASAALDVGVLEVALADARALGYEILAVSGGEPFVYRDLPRLLRAARSLGFHTSVTTNGTLLTPARLEKVGGLIDTLAISIDGPPSLHNTMRASPTAFARLEKGLAQVRSIGLRFGLIHTLTETSWPHLPWLAEFAADQSAGLLQLHPLERTGRAVDELPDELAPTASTLARAYLEALLLNGDHAGRLTIALDAVLRQDVIDTPALVYGDDSPDRGEFADQLGILAIEEDGAAVPISYGFSRDHLVADLTRERLTDGAERWRTQRRPGFMRLCAAVRAEIAGSEARLVNWHERVVSCSHSGALLAPS